MNRVPLSLPEIGLISGTRAAVGAGIAFLVSSRLKEDQRRAIGWTLLAVGALSTIPIAVELIKAMRAKGGSNGHIAGRLSHRKEHA